MFILYVYNMLFYGVFPELQIHEIANCGLMAQNKHYLMENNLKQWSDTVL